MKMLKQLVSLVVLIFAIMIVIPVSAAQSLPNSPWYTVLYQPESDTLHWINTGGEQATLPRPTLPDEAQYLDLRISPNGRYAVIVARLLNDRESMGIYDFEAGSFVQTHVAQVGESIRLGSMNIFTANSQYFAVGFMGGDFTTPEWRVILFETQYGASVAYIDHTFPDAPVVGLAAPLVQFVDGGTVHFVFLPQAVGGWIQSFAAYSWQAMGVSPGSATITESAYNRPDIALLPLTGEVVEASMDNAFPITAPDGQIPNYNVIGRRNPKSDDLVNPVHADTQYLLKASWAHGGDWILYYSSDPNTQVQNWNILLADGTPDNNSAMPFDPQYREVFGTNDGYLLLNQAKTLFFTNGFLPNTALSLFTSTPNAKVVYVTPIGTNFTLSQLGGENPVPPAGSNDVAVFVPSPTPQVIVVSPTPAVATCFPVQPSRVSVGVQARVLPSMGGLNVRQAPNGAIVTTLAGAATFTIVDGPTCVDSLYWWQIQRPGLTGWLAEATGSGYFIEPYQGPASDGLVAPTATDVPAAVPPVVVTTPAPVVEVGCEQASPTRIHTAMFAIVNVDSLRPYQSPNGAFVERKFYLSGTSLWVLGGPVCAGGQRWWRVSGAAKIGHIGNNIEATDAWVSEGMNGSYNIRPQ